jgi:DNA invertase Pin-like site-specific DNA recombinase
VIWKLDRLARSLRQLIDTTDTLEKAAIGFKSLTEVIDTNSPGGRLIFHIFGALSEFERGLIKERTIAGLRAAREMGKTGGRPSSLNISDLTVAKAMLKDKGITVREIAKRLKVNSSTLYRHLPGGRSSLEDSS